ncbi:DUF551 domain-containing protein [Enterobacter ludwigii]|uniref:DUF551 domain-containing protein n=1 Tax=Enterobacter ludwigii TaxID=299767 RepID=UPI0009B1F854|nr:DUF551 domain-containing protein [Enterobacter ludwigii]
MSTITKESITDTIEGLEHLANSGIQSVYIDMAIAGMRRLLASLEAEAVYQFIYNNPYEEGYTEWLDCNKDYFNGVPEDCRRILYTATPVPASDSLISELLAIAKKAAEDADECAHAEWNDDSMEHSAAISDWERRAAMLQGADGNSPDGWVACSERMPDEYDFDIWVFSLSQGVRDGIQWDGEEFADDEYQCKLNDVSHWMKKIYPAAPQQEVK